jgi:hypothetical protein
MVSVCLDKNWAAPGRFFQSLPVPCGVGDKQGRGRAGQGARAGKDRAGGGQQGGASTGGGCTGEGGQHGRGRTNGCIMHRVHTSGGGGWSGVVMGYPLVYVKGVLHLPEQMGYR